jgi:hypothetical protein
MASQPGSDVSRRRFRLVEFSVIGLYSAGIGVFLTLFRGFFLQTIGVIGLSVLWPLMLLGGIYVITRTFKKKKGSEEN